MTNYRGSALLYVYIYISVMIINKDSNVFKVSTLTFIILQPDDI